MLRTFFKHKLSRRCQLYNNILDKCSMLRRKRCTNHNDHIEEKQYEEIAIANSFDKIQPEEYSERSAWKRNDQTKRIRFRSLLTFQLPMADFGLPLIEHEASVRHNCSSTLFLCENEEKSICEIEKEKYELYPNNLRIGIRRKIWSSFAPLRRISLPCEIRTAIRVCRSASCKHCKK